MDKLQLLRSQRNVVFRTIEAVGLVPSDFEWQEREYTEPENPLLPVGFHISHPVDVLVHRPTGYHFTFGGFQVEYSPDEEDESGEAIALGWDKKFERVQEWLSYLKRETDPDLWEALRQQGTTVDSTFVSEIPTAPFTPVLLRT